MVYHGLSLFYQHYKWTIGLPFSPWLGMQGMGGAGGGALSSNNGDVSKNHWRLHKKWEHNR